MKEIMISSTMLKIKKIRPPFYYGPNSFIQITATTRNKPTSAIGGHIVLLYLVKLAFSKGP